MAIGKIRLVRGDNLPQLRFRVMDVDKNLPAQLTGLTDVYLKLREAGASTVLSTINGAWIESDGVVAFEFPNGTLDVPQGDYEGELEFHFGSKVQTAYELLKFFVRQDF